MNKKVILAGVVGLFASLSLTGCIKPYNKPEFIKIEPSQTAFVIPLVGDTKEQVSFESEGFLQNAKVASKEIQIPKREVQIGRMYYDIEWRPSATVIVVERKPETREWTATGDTGTSKTNQAVYAQSKDGIKFSIPMNISAQIDEKDAAKFLYRYNNKPLSLILDDEIRAMVESRFSEICSKYNFEESLGKKDEIVKEVKENVSSYFLERGINITVLGVKGGFEPVNKEVLETIEKKFKTSQDLISQDNINKKLISEAEALAKANEIKSNSITKNILDEQYLEKWDGKLPQVVTDGNMIYNMGE